MVIPISLKTPKAIKTSTPTTQTNPSTKPNQYNTTLINPVLYKNEKNIQQENIHHQALKMTQKLTKFNYRDTGFLANATAEERNQIIALPKPHMEHSKVQSKATDTRSQCHTWPDISCTVSLPCRFVHYCQANVDNTVRLRHK